MLTIALRNAFAARTEKLTAEMADIALRHHPCIAPLEDLERWLSRRSQVLYLQKSLLACAGPEDMAALPQRYEAELDVLQQQIRDRHAETMHARSAGVRPAHVVSEDGTRMVCLDHAEQARRMERFDARLRDEMAAHRRFRFGTFDRRGDLLADLEQEWAVMEQLIDELKQRMDELNLPAVDSSTRIGRQLSRVCRERRDAARDAGYHEGWLLACRRGDLPMVLTVLDEMPAAERKAFVDRLGPDGLSAWHLACEAHDLPMATLLLRHGACADLATELERPPLFVAVRVDRGDRTRTFLDWLLWQGAALHTRDQNGRSALNEAAWHGNVAAMRWLVEHGLDLHEHDCHRRTALHVAAAAGHGLAVTWLLRQGADPHARNAAGERPIFEAVRLGKAAAMRAFVDAGYWLDADERRQLRDSGMLSDPAIAHACNAPLTALLVPAGPASVAAASQGRDSGAQWQGGVV